tara:strand:- start:226 stop:2346 length:2121 start_codon:yes stop_codon:yes gene_type:complete
MSRKTGFYKGRLGIGLNTNDNSGIPQYPLDIDGDIRLTGAFRERSGRWLIASNYDSESQIKLYRGFQRDPSDNIYFDSGEKYEVIVDGTPQLQPGYLLKLGVNVESDFDTRSAVDISGGLSVDTITPSIRKPIDSYDISHVDTMSDGNIIIDENYNVEDDPSNVAIYIPIKENITDLSGLIQTSKKIKVTDTLFKFVKSENKYIALGPTGIINGWETQGNSTAKVLDETVGMSLDVNALNIAGDFTTNNRIDYLSSKEMEVDGDFIGETLVADSAEIKRNADISGILIVGNKLTVNKIQFVTISLDVSGVAQIDNSVFITDRLDAEDFDVSGVKVRVDASANVIHVKGKVYTDKEFTSTNNKITVENTVDVSENVLLKNKLDVGDMVINGYMDISGSMEVDKVMDVSGRVHVQNNLDISNNLNVDGSMNVYGGVNVRNHLEISGCTIENDMDISQVVISDSVDISNSFQLDGNIDIKGITTTPSMVGMISWFFRKNPPPGWLVCDGGEYPKAKYPDLSNCIGNTYNNDDILLSDISFNVPDLSGHFIRGINGIDQVDMINENITYVNDPTPEKIGDKKEFKTGCPKTEDGENKELIVDSSNNHNHILKDNSHNHVGKSVDNSNNTFDLTKNEYNIHILYDNVSSNVPHVSNIDDTVLNNITIDSASADIPEHNHIMDPSGSHIHTFENDDDETCPNFIYMLPCIKF